MANSDTLTTPGGYRILDEPRAGALQQVAVNPVWPFLAVMLGGTWICWPWFAVNGFAVGSPTRRRELFLVALGFAGSAGIFYGLSLAAGLGWIEGLWLKYAVVGLVVWKLWVSYRLYLLQARTFELYRYFGGTVRNGLIPVLVAFYLRFQVLGALPGPLRMILS